MPDPAHRADFTRNRERILTAARAALAETSDASLSAIAKAAGVGFGTLYRHFATREALVLTLYHSEMQRLVDRAPELLQAHEPLDALRLWLQEVARPARRPSPDGRAVAHPARARRGSARRAPPEPDHRRATGALSRPDETAVQQPAQLGVEGRGGG